MTLDQALTLYAEFLGLDAATLIRYAAEDDIGGYHIDPALAKFPSGSLWAVEGKTLFALMLALRPQKVMEFGFLHGASTNHLLWAAKNIGDTPEVTSVDVWAGAGGLIRHDLRRMAHLVYMDAFDYIPTLRDGDVDFVYEDMLHGYQQVYDFVQAIRPKLAPGAVVCHHDSEHDDDGVKIKQALTDAGVTFVSAVAAPSDCGIAVWRNT